MRRNPKCADIDGDETWTEHKYDNNIVQGLAVGRVHDVDL